MKTIKVKTVFQRVACSDKSMYISRPVTYSKIDTDELIEHASIDSGISRANVAAVFYAIIQQVEELLLNGHSIQLGQLGTLRFSMNCKASETIDGVGAENVVRRKILLSPGVKLKQALERVSLTGFTPDADEEETAVDDESGTEAAV